MASLKEYHQLTTEILDYLYGLDPFDVDSEESFADGLIKVTVDGKPSSVKIRSTIKISPESFVKIIEDSDEGFSVIRRGEEESSYSLEDFMQGQTIEDFIAVNLAKDGALSTRNAGFSPTGEFTYYRHNDGKDYVHMLFSFSSNVPGRTWYVWQAYATAAVTQAVAYALMLQRDSLVQSILQVNKRLVPLVGQDVSQLIGQYLFD